MGHDYFACPSTRDHRLGELTPREREIFRLVAKGMSNAEIATALTIGETTAKTHVAHVLMKRRRTGRGAAHEAAVTP